MHLTGRVARETPTVSPPWSGAHPRQAAAPKLTRAEPHPKQLIAYRVHAQQTSKRAEAREHYVTEVLRQRRLLAASLGVSKSTQLLRDALWMAAQYRRTVLVRPLRAAA